MEPCKFFVGQKVICIDATVLGPVSGKIKDRHLKLNSMYTIREIEPMQVNWKLSPPHDRAPAVVRLVEIVRAPYDGTELEPAYACTRFRPATDISSLEALLTGKPLSVKEDA